MTNKLKNIKFIVITIFSLFFFISFILPNISITLTKAFSRTMPGILVLDDAGNGNSKFAGSKGKTPFDHDQHISTRANTTCVTCHHTNSSDLSIALEEDVAKCATCHIGEESTCKIEGTNGTKKFAGKIAIEAKEAFHGNGSEVGCIGCHQQRNIEPLSCGGCHTDSDSVQYIIEPIFPKEKDKLKPAMPAKVSASSETKTEVSTKAETKESKETVEKKEEKKD